MGANLAGNFGEISLRRREDELLHVCAATNPNWAAEPSHGSQIIGSHKEIEDTKHKASIIYYWSIAKAKWGPIYSRGINIFRSHSPLLPLLLRKHRAILIRHTFAAGLTVTYQLRPIAHDGLCYLRLWALHFLATINVRA